MSAGVTPALVLHILPVDLARGAQTYAREMRCSLDDSETHHRTLTLFGPGAGTLQPDASLAVPSGVLRRVGLDPRAVMRLRKYLRVQRPRVVVAHGGEPLAYAVLAGVPRDQLVYYKIGIGGARLTTTKGTWHRWLLAHAGHVAAVSDAAADEARALGVGPERLRVIPNGRDPARYRLDRSDADGERPTRLVFVGHLTPSKRPAMFVDLVAALRRDGLCIEAAIAGDGPLLEDVRARARGAGVEVLGAVRDVADLLARNDVLVFTSVPEGEGMPGVLIEAGMAGLPVVTTDVPGASSVVADGQTGFVVPVGDFETLVRRTRELVTDPARRRLFGQEARQRCEHEYSLDVSLQRWRALLHEILNDPCTSST